jgi:hypothetical protein
VASLKKKIQIETSTILSSSSVLDLVKSSSTRNTTRTSRRTTRLAARAAQQEAHAQQCLHRICSPVTAFKVLDPQRRKHPYLFEHHPERIWSSFWRTQWGGLFPRSFWRALHPSQPSRPGRIIIYCLLSTLPIAIGSIAWIVAQAGLNLDMLTYALNYLSFRADGALYMALSYVLLPWLTLAALLIFQISMRRARVKQSHVLRTVCYSYDIAVIALAAALAAAALAADHWTIYLWITSNVWSSMADTDMFLFWGAWLFAPVMALIVYRIGTAYQRYLKFRHPYLTVALSQIVVFLILVVGWMQLIW